MKITVLIILFFFLQLTSCAQYEPEGGETILDSLVIQTWVLDEQFEGNGTWMYEAKTRENGFNRDEGYWLSDDGSRLTGDDVFVYERLELNKPRILAPMGYHYMDGVNFHLGYDGRVEVALVGGNEYAVILNSFENPEEPWNGKLTASKQFTALAPLAFQLRPYGKFFVEVNLYRHTLAGQEYYVGITTYDGDDTPIIEATLKLASIDDPGYPYPDKKYSEFDRKSIYAPDDNMTRFLTVELIEYGFSDKYRIEYGIPDSEEVTELPDDVLVGYY